MPVLFDALSRISALLWVLLAGGAVTAWCTWVTGGFRFAVGDWRVASFSVRRPFTAAAIAGLLLALDPHRRARLSGWVHRGTLPLALGSCAVFAILQAAPYAAATDMYGYVAQALDWRAGRLIHDDWLAGGMFPPAAAVPVGYVHVTTPTASAVPAYPPGTSLHMALAGEFGDWAMYAVSPLAALAVVLGTYALGRARFDETSARVAAAIVACTPVLVAQATLPMSDTVAAAYWTWSLVLAGRPHAASQAAAGILAGIAVLVRPSLAPLVVGPAGLAWAVTGGAGAARVVGAALPGVAFLGWHNLRVYGGLGATGYGDVSLLFSPSNIATNVLRYGRWLMQTMTPLPLLGAAFAMWSLVADRRRDLWALALLAAVTLGIHLLYQPWPHWAFARFLLPALPVVTLFAVAWARRVLATRPLVFAALVLVVLGGQMDFEQRSELRRTNEALGRFAALPAALRDHGLLDRPLVTRLHSGSLRHYAGIAAARWDVMSPEALRDGVAAALASGVVPLLVDDSDDREAFEHAFGPLSCWADVRAPLLVLERHAVIRILAMRPGC